MEVVDILVIVAVAVIIVGFIGLTVWKKKTGKNTGCGYSCDGCCRLSCPSARPAQEDKEKENAEKLDSESNS